MSNTPSTSGIGAGTSPTTVIIASVAAMFCFAVAGAVAIVFAVPEGGNAGSLIVILFGALAATIPALVAVAQVASMRGQVNNLTNGLMDSKIRAGVADVLPPGLVDPTMSDQLDTDRQVRNRHRGDTP